MKSYSATWTGKRTLRSRGYIFPSNQAVLIRDPNDIEYLKNIGGLTINIAHIAANISAPKPDLRYGGKTKKTDTVSTVKSTFDPTTIPAGAAEDESIIEEAEETEDVVEQVEEEEKPKKFKFKPKSRS